MFVFGLLNLECVEGLRANSIDILFFSESYLETVVFFWKVCSKKKNKY